MKQIKTDTITGSPAWGIVARLIEVENAKGRTEIRVAL